MILNKSCVSSYQLIEGLELSLLIFRLDGIGVGWYIRWMVWQLAGIAVSWYGIWLVW